MGVSCVRHLELSTFFDESCRVCLLSESSPFASRTCVRGCGYQMSPPPLSLSLSLSLESICTHKGDLTGLGMHLTSTPVLLCLDRTYSLHVLHKYTILPHSKIRSRHLDPNIVSTGHANVYDPDLRHPHGQRCCQHLTSGERDWPILDRHALALLNG